MCAHGDYALLSNGIAWYWSLSQAILKYVSMVILS